MTEPVQPGEEVVEQAVQPEAAAGESAPAPQTGGPGCLSSLEVWLAGLSLSVFSPTFYRKAARQRVIGAIGFLVVIGLILTLLITVSVARGMIAAGQEIREQFEVTEFPDIHISGGVAEVDGQQPYVIMDEERTLLVVDTTGAYTSIDRSRYDQGLVLTKYEVILLSNDGQYQELSLGDLNAAFGDPIIINERTLQNMWSGLGALIAIFTFLGTAIWYILVRLSYLALIGLVVWGITALIRSGTGFGPVLVTGIYATIPAMILRFMLAQVNVRFPGLFTLFLLVVWAYGLFAALTTPRVQEGDTGVSGYFAAERPLRGWRTLIAVPFLLDLCLEIVFSWDAWYVTWSLGLLTLGALLIVSLLPMLMSRGGSSAPSEPAV